MVEFAAVERKNGPDGKGKHKVSAHPLYNGSMPVEAGPFQIRLAQSDALVRGSIAKRPESFTPGPNSRLPTCRRVGNGLPPEAICGTIDRSADMSPAVAPTSDCAALWRPRHLVEESAKRADDEHEECLLPQRKRVERASGTSSRLAERPVPEELASAALTSRAISPTIPGALGMNTLSCRDLSSWASGRVCCSYIDLDLEFKGRLPVRSPGLSCLVTKVVLTGPAPDPARHAVPATTCVGTKSSAHSTCAAASSYLHSSNCRPSERDAGC